MYVSNVMHLDTSFQMISCGIGCDQLLNDFMPMGPNFESFYVHYSTSGDLLYSLEFILTSKDIDFEIGHEA